MGFEPTDAFTSPVFKTGAFDHSAISPYAKFRGYTPDAGYILPCPRRFVNKKKSSVIPTFVWVFYFQTLFRPSDSFQLFCGISVLSPDFGRATSSNFCVGFPPSKRIVYKKGSWHPIGHQLLSNPPKIFLYNLKLTV